MSEHAQQSDQASPDELLKELAAEFGIATEFWDWQGRHVDVAAETIVAALRAFGVDATTPEAARMAVADRQVLHWARMLPPCMVIRQGQAPSVWVHVQHGNPVHVWVELENGGEREHLRQLEDWTPPHDVDGVLVGQASFEVPADLPLGYHTLRAASHDTVGAMPLIVTPSWVGLPERLGSRRAWGLAAQLYSVRSRGSWGVGDLTDLTDLAVWSAAEHGADYTLINPVHSAQLTVPMEPSPYLPTTRRFANPIYLRIERIPEYAYLDDAVRERVDALRSNLAVTLDGVDAINRDTVWEAKRQALAALYAAGRSPGRQFAYEAYRRREGQGLADYATWCALADVHTDLWWKWPEELRSPRSPEVAAFRESAAAQIDFYCWLQWVLDEQLAGAQAAATGAGMTLGVMHDLAVGVHPQGADTWRLQDVFASGVTVGAPADAYNQAGQDWSQPPWRPDRLAEVAYEPFREIVATTLRHAGGVRVDHVIGLFRLWWIPEGLLPKDGTYVRYDYEAMVGILALEAHRAGAVVVGEDVGTVEPWVRTYLKDRGILGTSILWFEFEYEGSGAPLRPEWWRELCMASVTTHDLPPTAGYLAGEHVYLRDALGLLTRPLDEELEAAAAERQAWLDNLRWRWALGEGDDVETTVRALHKYLTWTPSRLLCVALTDAVGDRRTQNQPGTTNEYPNWRVPLTGPDGKPVLLEDTFTSARAAALIEVVRP